MPRMQFLALEDSPKFRVAEINNERILIKLDSLARLENNSGARRQIIFLVKSRYSTEGKSLICVDESGREMLLYDELTGTYSANRPQPAISPAAPANILR